MTLSNDQDSLDLYSVPSKGSSLEHGKRVYRHINGYDIRVFVSETKEAEYSPIEYQFWRDYFSSDTVTCHVFQGAIDYCT